MNPGPESLARHELIGLEVQVAFSSNPSQTGLKALVVDETRNTLLLETESRVLRLAKKGTNLVFTLPDGRHVGVFGSILVSQPENRISKRMQKTRWKL
ncbi:MAG: ribonuclease P protein component 1 [Methanothrix sp.]|nr:ribonuclease P protein component 1 [Methanothrix sp.]